MKVEDFKLTKKDQKKIIKAIQKAEKNTSGEIRVHIHTGTSQDHFKAAIDLFETLKMNETQHRNGVLIHISPEDQNITIIGDIGIHQVTPENFWDEIKETIVKKFKQKEYVKGLTKGIKMAGKALKKHFPYQKGDINELPDEISWS